MKSQELTIKEEKACIEYVECGSMTDAYISAFGQGDATRKSINERASRLFSKRKIVARVQKLKDQIELEGIYSINKSIKRDLKLISKYEAAVEIIENTESPQKEIEAAQRVCRAIGVTGYNGAQDRVSKMLGYFEKDNRQTSPKTSINIPPIKWVEEDDKD